MIREHQTNRIAPLEQAAGPDPLPVLREALAKATEGPWEADVLGSEGYQINRVLPEDARLREKMRRSVFRVNWLHFDTDRANAEFIVAARNLLPVLLDEVEALRKVVDGVRALHVPWYEVNGVRYEMRAYSNEAPEGHVCVKPGESPYGDECNAEEEAHYVLACAECRCVVEDGEVAGYWLWPCDTARLLAVLDKEDK